MHSDLYWQNLVRWHFSFPFYIFSVIKQNIVNSLSGLAFEFIFYICMRKQDFRNSYTQSKKKIIKKLILEAPLGLQDASELKNNTQLPTYNLIVLNLKLETKHMFTERNITIMHLSAVCKSSSPPSLVILSPLSSLYMCTGLGNQKRQVLISISWYILTSRSAQWGKTFSEGVQ
jgi:hypothetical protein